MEWNSPLSKRRRETLFCFFFVFAVLFFFSSEERLGVCVSSSHDVTGLKRFSRPAGGLDQSKSGERGKKVTDGLKIGLFHCFVSNESKQVFVMLRGCLQCFMVALRRTNLYTDTAIMLPSVG